MFENSIKKFQTLFECFNIKFCKKKNFVRFLCKQDWKNFLLKIDITLKRSSSQLFEEEQSKLLIFKLSKNIKFCQVNCMKNARGLNLDLYLNNIATLIKTVLYM